MPGNPAPTVPNDLPRLDGWVTPCGALAPEAVEDIVDDGVGGCVGSVPSGWVFWPGWFCGPEGSEGVCARATDDPVGPASLPSKR